jgi:hypothetical protein
LKNPEFCWLCPVDNLQRVKENGMGRFLAMGSDIMFVVFVRKQRKENVHAIAFQTCTSIK